MLVPAGIYLLFNFGLVTQSGAGIRMATDITFVLGVLSLLRSKVPTFLKLINVGILDIGFTMSIFITLLAFEDEIIKFLERCGLISL